MGRARAVKGLSESELESFVAFWEAYPRRQAKIDAMKAWGQLRPSPEVVDAILEALAWQIHQPSWADGQFVPLPASWLRAERWHDEPATSKTMRTTPAWGDWVCPHEPSCLARHACYVKRELYEARLRRAARL